MKRLPVIVALVALAAMLLAFGAARATEYSNFSACRTMRNVVIGAPFLPEPNRADTRKAQLLWGGDPSILGASPYAVKQYVQAFALLQKIDGEGTDALAALPPDTPRIDPVIDFHVNNLMVARLMLAVFYEQGRLGRPDPAQAAAFYQKAFDTTFTDDRGCVHSTAITEGTRNRYVALLVYDLRTPEARDKALAILKDGGPRIRGRVLSARQEHAANAPVRILRSQSPCHGRGLTTPAADRRATLSRARGARRGVARERRGSVRRRGRPLSLHPPQARL